MIIFNQLSRDYLLGNQTVHALREVSGKVFAGEMVALCGPSGSGKSTLLNIFGMLDTLYGGEVTFEGNAYPTGQMQAAKMRREKLGFVFQKFNLVPVMTALENVVYPLHLNGYSKAEQTKLASEMLEHVGLGEFIHHMPDNLSGGQQQRVAIARALVHKPSLVIADEPTASLDSQTANKVIDIMKGLGHEMGTTFIIATHDPRMASRCDRTFELVDGKITHAHLGAEEVSWAS
ncbi:ABC transporter ATP-binding protein [Vibrio sp. FJH11]